VKSINASFAAMSKILTNMGKLMREERKREAQEHERRLRTRDLKNAADALEKRHASPHSRRVVLTGLHEYWRVISTHSQPEPAATISPTVPGLVLSDIVAQPVAWLWQHYLPPTTKPPWLPCTAPLIWGSTSSIPLTSLAMGIPSN
jgi:hypothetical protein